MCVVSLARKASADAQYMDLSRFAGVVSAKGFDFFPEWAARQRFKEVRERRMRLEVRLRHDQVIPCSLERDEIQVELLGRGPNADSHFGLTLRNSPCDVDMRRCNTVIPSNVRWVYPGCPQLLIEQQSRPRALFAVHECHHWFCEIGG